MVVEDRESRETSSLAFNSDARLFAAVGADPQINLYDAQTKKRIRTFEATSASILTINNRCDDDDDDYDDGDGDDDDDDLKSSFKTGLKTYLFSISYPVC